MAGFELKLAEAERLEKYRAIQRQRENLGAQVQAHVINIFSMKAATTDKDEIADLDAELQKVVDEMKTVQALIADPSLAG
jgi:hypothetical protein